MMEYYPFFYLTYSSTLAPGVDEVGQPEVAWLGRF